MRTDLTNRRAAAVGTRGQRQLERRLAEVQLPGQLAAAKIESAAFATHVALQHTAMLSAAEARLLAQAPLGEARYRAIVDAFAGYCCQELALLAHK